MKLAIVAATLLLTGCGLFKNSTKAEYRCDEGDTSTVCGQQCYALKCVGGKMVEDKELTAKMWAERYKRLRHYRELVWALQTRPLSKDEMAEVEQLREDILTQDGVPYYPEEIKREFHDLMLLQYNIRESGHRLDTGGKP